MPKISVIIPVYNVGKVLPRCLDSLIGQTFRDWEAICVDDGSRDSSPGILDAYARRDARFRVVHKRNAGVSEARNDAVALAEGEYMLFLDSDDFLHPQTMEICLYMAERDGSDMVAYTYDRKFRIESLKVAVAAAEKLYETGVEASSKAKWEKNFLVPFKDKLRRKEKNA